ncbi:hypothetical protein [Micromonospora sp. CPCC 206061]|uniref:hypothetical protein n=1 Tax=Micromonospora sp. CPCC 206061 TaxID=3122410 RepID=UPI002FEF7CBF
MRRRKALAVLAAVSLLAAHQFTGLRQNLGDQLPAGHLADPVGAHHRTVVHRAEQDVLVGSTCGCGRVRSSACTG